jgi:hypothetical protein
MVVLSMPPCTLRASSNTPNVIDTSPFFPSLPLSSHLVKKKRYHWLNLLG